MIIWLAAAVTVGACTGPSGSPGAGAPASGTAEVGRPGASAPALPAHGDLSAPCAAGLSMTSCASSHPKLTADWTNLGDTTGCLFRYTVSWGDGTRQAGQKRGGPRGSSFLASHTYAAPGRYTYRASGRAVSGSCRFRPSTARFRYVLTFTVRGSLPVFHSSSQDTHAQAPPGSVCDSVTFARDKSEGNVTATGFGFLGADSAQQLLRQFLAGRTPPFRFSSSSSLAHQLAGNPAFRALNASVKASIRAQLRAGRRTVVLRSPVLQRIALSTPEDLALSIGGTQGLVVSGHGRLAGGHYTGTLTYSVQDSYGFDTGDHFHGVGDDMRYLQTVCGNPPHQGGAHWFPDSITLTTSFRLRARH